MFQGAFGQVLSEHKQKKAVMLKRQLSIDEVKSPLLEVPDTATALHPSKPQNRKACERRNTRRCFSSTSWRSRRPRDLEGSQAHVRLTAAATEPSHTGLEMSLETRESTPRAGNGRI